MAAGTGALLSGAIGLGLTGVQALTSAREKRDRERELNAYERQDLENAFEDMPISTVGSELLREEGQRTTAAAVDSARNAGVRGIVGAVPQIVAANNDLNRDAQRYLDDQIMKRNYAIAGDNQNIRGMQERREEQDLAGLGNAVNVANQNMWSGIYGMGTSAANLGYGIDNYMNKSGQASQGAIPVPPISYTQPAQPTGGPVQTFNPNQMYNPFPNPTPYSPNTFNPMNFGGF